MEKVAQREHLVWSWLLNQEGCKKYIQNFVAHSDKHQCADTISPSCCNVMKCNLFAFYKSKLGYNPVDIDIVTYILI
jgi:hypothetical protein